MKMNKALSGSTRHYFWQGRGPIALMIVLALSCTSSSQAQETALPVQLASLTAAPTSSPVEAPTTLFAPTEPVEAPTMQTGTEPTMPSDLPFQLLSPSDVEMTIGGIFLPLSNAAISIIEELTSDTIWDTIFAVLGEDQIDSLSVGVHVTSPVSRKLRGGTRNLAETKLTLDVVILIQSLITDHNTDRYIYGAFNETTTFIDELKGSGDAAFANVDSVSVAPLTDGNVQGRTEDPNEDSRNGNQDNTITIVVSVVVVIAAIGIGLAAFFFFRRRSSNKGKESHKGRESHHESSHGTGSLPHSMSSDDSVEIQVNKDMGCEISTLGDFSTIPEHQAVATTDMLGKMEEDLSFYDYVLNKTGNDAIEHNSTNELVRIEDFSSFGDYDAFKKSGNGTIKTNTTNKNSKTNTTNIKPAVLEPIVDDYSSSDGEYDLQTSFCSCAYTASMADTNDSKPTTLSSMTCDGDLDTQVFLEDDTNTFEVEVPPGLLGLVLVDSDKGVPVVHLVKDSSPLTGKVQPGDRLVGVDGKDVTLMWATDVSCLVAKKKNQTRRLLFSKPRENQLNAPNTAERTTTNPLKRALVVAKSFNTGTDSDYDADKEYVA
jgi:hypothetical protein